MKRCYGVAKKIADCDWEYISTLRSSRSPHVGMPRLSDVLGLLAENGMQKTWCVLDIKVCRIQPPPPLFHGFSRAPKLILQIDDDADQLLSSMRQVLDSVKGPVPWEERILLGCWNVRIPPLRIKNLPFCVLIYEAELT